MTNAYQGAACKSFLELSGFLSWFYWVLPTYKHNKTPPSYTQRFTESILFYVYTKDNDIARQFLDYAGGTFTFLIEQKI